MAQPTKHPPTPSAEATEGAGPPAELPLRRVRGKQKVIGLVIPMECRPKHCAWSRQKGRWLFQTRALGFIRSFSCKRAAAGRLPCPPSADSP